MATASTFRDHILHVEVAEILQLQASLEFSKLEITENETYSFERDKVFAIVHVLHDLLRETPAERVSILALDQIRQHIHGVLRDLRNYISDGEQSKISSAAEKIDESIGSINMGFISQLDHLSQGSISKQISAQAASAREAVKQLSEQREQLRAQLAELQAKLAKQEENLSELVTGSARERAEAAAAVAYLNRNFEEHETKRLGEFQTQLSEFRSNFGIFDKKIREDGEKLIVELEGRRDEAAKIVQIVGNIGVTGNYQKIAVSEAKQAVIWRRLTVMFFSFGVILAGATFFKAFGETLSVDMAWAIVIRLLYAIVITLPAIYTARESARHRTNSDRARQTELELASIGPFIESLRDEKKMEIREQLIKHYFGKPVENHTIDSLPIAKILDTIVKIVRESKK